MYKAGKHTADTARTLLLQAVNMAEAYINSIGNCLRRPVLQIHSLQHLLLLQRLTIHRLRHLFAEQMLFRHLAGRCQLRRHSIT